MLSLSSEYRELSTPPDLEFIQDSLEGHCCVWHLLLLPQSGTKDSSPAARLVSTPQAELNGAS
jgi:hypothetical protein